MSTFWIVGIVLNVSLTGLILYWLTKQGKPNTPNAEAAKSSPIDTVPRKPAVGATDVD